MYVIIVGVLSDYKGRVLLQNNDQRTLAPIHRPPEPGALPTDTLTRAFREETGLIVLPVRLAGLHFRANPSGDELAFYFRCNMRGGEINVPDGRPPAGFFDSSPLPRALSPRFRGPLAAAVRHAGGSPLLAREDDGAGQWLKRLFGGQPAPTSSDDWEIAVRVIARRPDDRLVWTRPDPQSAWQLPTTAPVAGEAPWQAAERLTGQAGLSGGAATLKLVEVEANRPVMTLAFTVPLAGDARLTADDTWIGTEADPTAAGQFSPADLRLLARQDDPTAPTFILSGE